MARFSSTLLLTLAVAFLVSSVLGGNYYTRYNMCRGCTDDSRDGRRMIINEGERAEFDERLREALLLSDVYGNSILMELCDDYKLCLVGEWMCPEKTVEGNGNVVEALAAIEVAKKAAGKLAKIQGEFPCPERDECMEAAEELFEAIQDQLEAVCEIIYFFP